jgi:hypothetical protein
MKFSNQVWESDMDIVMVLYLKSNQQEQHCKKTMDLQLLYDEERVKIKLGETIDIIYIVISFSLFYSHIFSCVSFNRNKYNSYICKQSFMILLYMFIYVKEIVFIYCLDIFYIMIIVTRF